MEKTLSDRESLERLADMLGGWPDYFGEAERGHGLSLLGQVRRDRLIDEGVFGQVCRYAVFRAGFDQVSREIRDVEDKAAGAPDGDEDQSEGYLSGLEQKRAYFHNKVSGLEHQLIATPYQRAKLGDSAQSSFMDILTETPRDEGGDGKVTPFKPMGSKGRGH